MSKEWQVRSVEQSGDRVHIELQEGYSRSRGPLEIIAAAALSAVILWSFGAWDDAGTARDRGPVWTAAADQALVCGEGANNPITFFKLDGTWRVTERQPSGTDLHYAVQVQANGSGFYMVGPDAVFAYDAETRNLSRQGSGGWSDCRVATAG